MSIQLTSHTRRRRTFLFGLVLPVLAVTAVGCGNDAEDVDEAVDALSTETVATTAQPGTTLSADGAVSSAPITDYYPYNGKVQTVPVPPGATAVEITLVSGRGGDSNGKGGTATSVTARWAVSQNDTITFDLGSGGTEGAAGLSSSTTASGGAPGCNKAGGGGGASIVSVNNTVIAVAGGGGGGGYYGASLITDEGGSGGSSSGTPAGNGRGPAAGHAGATGNNGTAVGPGGNGGNGKNLGGCGGGGGGGRAGGGGGTGGSTGGGGGGGGGAGGSYANGNIDNPVYTDSQGYGARGDGFVELTFTS